MHWYVTSPLTAENGQLVLVVFAAAYWSPLDISPNHVSQNKIIHVHKIIVRLERVLMQTQQKSK